MACREQTSCCNDGSEEAGELLQKGSIWQMSSTLPSFRRDASMTDRRHVRLFRNGRNQAVRIPVEFELPGNEAIMHRDGERLVIEPVRKRGLVALLKTMKPIESGIPDIDDPLPRRENVF
jgi:antitoxin VapB